MIVAFAIIGAFLYWLNVTAVGTAVAIVDAPEDDPYADALEVTMNVLQGDPLQFEGAMLRIAGVDVVSRVGEQAFWTELPNEQPFFVKLGPLVVADSITVAQGDVAQTLIGMVRTMSDSVLNSWEEEGAFEGSQTGRLEAEFAEVFLEVEHLELVPPAPQSSPPDGSQ